MRIFLAHWLILLAAWTLVIKFVFPLVFDTAYNHPVGTHIYWDFWWCIHLWLAYALYTRPAYLWWFAVVVSVIEIGIIGVKFYQFLLQPDWTVWQANWFINKVFVLSCFVVLLAYCLFRRKQLVLEPLPA